MSRVPIPDRELVAFLQWALPRAGFRWAGFRRVRRQVKRRLGGRLAELALDSLVAYRRYLESHPDEWRWLDGACRITISRFWRDRRAYERLGERLGSWLKEQESKRLRCWSAGCASGEEPYSLLLLWTVQLGQPLERIDVLATDANAELLDRARRGVYPASSLAELPDACRAAFDVQGSGRIAHSLRAAPRFAVQDLRQAMPDGPFGLIACRNLVFTYFDERNQMHLLEQLVDRLTGPRLLFVGAHEAERVARLARVYGLVPDPTTPALLGWRS